MGADEGNLVPGLEPCMRNAPAPATQSFTDANQAFVITAADKGTERVLHESTMLVVLKGKCPRSSHSVLTRTVRPCSMNTNGARAQRRGQGWAHSPGATETHTLPPGGGQVAPRMLRLDSPNHTYADAEGSELRGASTHRKQCGIGRDDSPVPSRTFRGWLA